MSLLLIVVMALVVWSALGTLRRRVDGIAARLSVLDRLESDIAGLTERIAVLERSGVAAPGVDAQTVADVVVEATVPVDVVPPAVLSTPVDVPGDDPPVAVPVIAPPPVVVSAAAEAPDIAATPLRMPAETERAPASEPETWEVVVGTSWLNKIGVLILVTGLALLLGYSMTHVGPFGRVLIGFVLSAAMLGIGVALERRPDSRNYGHGLIAGGWAGVYVTAFAMRAIPAARILDSDLAGLATLLVVASGMVAHSLRYRSETVTTLAFVAAYVPLALTPLSMFSLVAAVPLAIALLVVAQRFGWSTISAVGLATTYGLFALRGRVLPGALPDATALPPYLALMAYWLAFEAADVIGLRSGQRTAASRTIPLFVLNAVGSLGAALMLADRGGDDTLFVVLIAASAAYLTSAALRARLLGTREAAAEREMSFSTAHGALALAAAMVARAIDLRMTGSQQTFAWLLETQLLIAAGLTLGDRHVRRVGTALAGLVTVHVLFVVAGTGGGEGGPWGMSAWTPVVAIVAATWYANREWLRARSIAPGRLERVYPWAALLMVGIIIGHDVPSAYQGLAGTVLAVLLIEAAIRRAPDYRAQSYVTFLCGAVAVAAAYVPESVVTGRATVWSVLTAVTGLAYLYAWRVGRTGDVVSGATRVMAGIAAWAGTASLVLFEWRVTTPAVTSLAWATTAVVLVWLGTRRPVPGLRWQAYAVFALAISYVSQWSAREIGLAERAGATAVAAPVTALLVFAAAYLGMAIVRRHGASGGDSLDTAAQLERLALYGLPVVTTLHLITFEARCLEMRIVPAAWTATAVALFAAGLRWKAIDIRAQSYFVFAAGVLAAFAVIMQLPQSRAVPWVTVAIAGLYGTALLSRSALRVTAGQHGAAAARVEAGVRVALMVAATMLLLVLIAVDVRPSLITMGWGLQGTALLVAGFAARERALRLAGLGLLFLCILKLFVYDLSELEALPRILSFVVLGLVLLGVSWTYTRYKEQIRKLF